MTKLKRKFTAGAWISASVARAITSDEVKDLLLS